MHHSLDARITSTSGQYSSILANPPNPNKASAHLGIVVDELEQEPREPGGTEPAVPQRRYPEAPVQSPVVRGHPREAPAQGPRLGSELPSCMQREWVGFAYKRSGANAGGWGRKGKEVQRSQVKGRMRQNSVRERLEQVENRGNGARQTRDHPGEQTTAWDVACCAKGTRGASRTGNNVKPRRPPRSGGVREAGGCGERKTLLQASPIKLCCVRA